MTLSCVVEKLFPLSFPNEKTRLLEKEYGNRDNSSFNISSLNI